MYLTVKILALLLFMANGKVHVARWINKAHIISCKLSISNEYVYLIEYQYPCHIDR